MISDKTFADFLVKTSSNNDRILGKDKVDLLRNAKGKILEIGAADGKNLQYYPKGSNVYLLEPNSELFPILQKKAERSSHQYTLLQGTVENLHDYEGEFDTVVSTHVLCSVEDVPSSIACIKDLLIPEGEFLFIEHILHPESNGMRIFQYMCNPIQRQLFRGCNCNRKTNEFIEQAGFSSLELHIETRKLFMPHVHPHVIGRAIK